MRCSGSRGSGNSKHAVRNRHPSNWVALKISSITSNIARMAMRGVGNNPCGERFHEVMEAESDHAGNLDAPLGTFT